MAFDGCDDSDLLAAVEAGFSIYMLQHTFGDTNHLP